MVACRLFLLEGTGIQAPSGVIQKLATNVAQGVFGMMMVTAIDRHHRGYGLLFALDSTFSHDWAASISIESTRINHEQIDKYLTYLRVTPASFDFILDHLNDLTHRLSLAIDSIVPQGIVNIRILKYSGDQWDLLS
jgi:hypothetical protein